VSDFLVPILAIGKFAENRAELLDKSTALLLLIKKWRI